MLSLKSKLTLFYKVVNYLIKKLQTGIDSENKKIIDNNLVIINLQQENKDMANNVTVATNYIKKLEGLL